MLTKKEDDELDELRRLRSNDSRWFSKLEFDRINVLVEKKIKYRKPYNVV